jgi:ketosteroid isomerase-like protein
MAYRFEMTTFSRAEVEAAWAEFQRRGVQTEDWPAWADMFTDDALYEEHNLGVMRGRQAIHDFIIACMADYPSMTLFIEWTQIEGNRIAFYIWNNLPDPAGGTASYQFPNTTILQYAGDGKFDWEADFYNPADAERVFGAWLKAGGRKTTLQDRSLTAVPNWAPPVPTPDFPREEVEREFFIYRDRGRLAVATGDWNQWADQFADDANYFEHHYGRFHGQAAIREWITGVMQPFPTMEFPPSWYSIEGNRVCALIPNVLPDPVGGDGYFGFDVFVILHYAGNGKWSYEEDIYNPREAQAVIGSWIKAGGKI